MKETLKATTAQILAILQLLLFAALALCCAKKQPTPRAAEGPSRAAARPMTPAPTPTCVPTKVAENHQLHIMFTGVLTFKKTAHGFYRVIMPALKQASPEHIAYIRYAKEDLLPSTLQPPLPVLTPPFECCGIRQDAVELVREKVTVEGADGHITDLGKLRDSLVRLKELAEGDDFNVDDYDQDSPGPLVAAQIDLPSGDLEAKRDQADFEWYFETSDHIKSAEPPRCLAQGVLLKLKKLPGSTVTLTATDGQTGMSRKLKLSLGDHGPTFITIGNSLIADAFCKGLSSGDVDEHFENQYRMLRNGNADRKYLPTRDKKKKCKSLLAGIESVNSIGGSDCLGSQWP